MKDHRQDVKDADEILGCKHFQAVGNNFGQHPKFMIMDILVNVSNVKGERLIQRENFWIEKVKTLLPLGLN